jgi:Tol biopolymer transport system component/O-antigen ligase
MTLVQTPEAASGRNDEPRRRGPAWLAILLTLAVIAIAALALGPTGSKAVYVLVGVGAAVIVLISIRDLIGPPIADAVDRVRPRPVEGLRPFSKARTAVGVVLAALAAGALAFVVADAGTKVLYGVIALVVLAIGLWLLTPALELLVDTEPSPYRPPLPRGKGSNRVGLDEAAELADVLDDDGRSGPVIDLRDDGSEDGWPDPKELRAEQWAAMGLAPETQFAQRGCLSRAAAMFLAVMAAGIVAFLAAQMGSKALLALAGGILVVACVVRARDKTLFMVFLTVCSLTFLLHKSFGPQDLTLSGGAPAVYVTSFDALLLLLYGLWVSEGTFVADVRAAFHRRILWVPLIGALLLLPSMLVAGGDTWHSLAELARMSWMYLLFFYVAVRVRSRPMVWAILGGLGMFAAVEFVVVVLQWKTGGVLGLSFLGVPTQLTSRTTDTSELGRPFGTIIHPVFMGAAMGALGLLAFAFGLTLKRSLTKVAALAITAACVLCLYLSHTRAALVAFVVVLLGMIVVAIAHKQLSWQTVGRVVLALLIGAAVFFPQLEARFEENFGTGHFSEEVTSRYQLNDLAGHMIDDHPLLGVGLNNFEVVMGPYENHGIIFINNPVHNLYLLYLAETGIIGLAGLLFVGIAMYNVALRLARSRDRLLGGVGLGVAGAMAFLFIEELLGFSLRQDQPLALYWILAGLAVACYRMSGLEGWRRPRRHRGVGRPGAGGTSRGSDSGPADSVWVPAYATRGRGGNGPHRSNAPSNEADGELVATSRRGPIARTMAWRQRRREARVDLALSSAAQQLAGNLRSDRPALEQLPSDLARALRALPAVPTAGSPRRGPSSPVLLGRPQPIALPLVGATPRPPWIPRSFERRSYAGRFRFGLAVVLAVALLGAGLQRSQNAQASNAVPISQMKILFAATSLPTAPHFGEGIFESNGDGSGLKKLLWSDTGRVLFNWPQFAMGGTKIVFTVRDGPPVSVKDQFGRYENVWIMNADGRGLRPLTHYKFRAGQPKVSPDGRSVIFTAENPQAPLAAVYKLDLRTLEATSLSQVTQPDGSSDADPRWTADGSILMASTTVAGKGTAIDEIAGDGSNRRKLVDDGKFNTDAAVSPDGSQLAYSAFQGSNPLLPGELPDPLNPDDVKLNPEGWIITVRDQHTGHTVALTKGQACAGVQLCAPGDSSGWKPLWSPDSKTVAWTGRLNFDTSCICAANADGSDPRVLVKSDNLVIKWFEWGPPGGQPPSTAVPDSQIGSEKVSSRLLISSEDLRNQVPRVILDEPVDMMGDDLADTGTVNAPTQGSWDASRSEFVFVGDTAPLTPYQLDHPQYGPPPPPGQHVHEHFTLQEIEPASPRFEVGPTTAEKQIFLHRADGTIVQLTTPWTEDWRDAIDRGDVRSNTDPVLSPDGRYVVFTNHSGLSGESFLLRMDLKTGAVLNLTNGTAGAQQVDDALPKWSPDSTKIAFTWTEGTNTNVFVMNASDGKAVTHVTDDNAFDMDPTWAPDGRSIVFSRHGGTINPSPIAVDTLVGLPATGWSLVKVDVRSGQQTVLTRPGDSPTWRPVFSPDGSRIDFIGHQYKTNDIFWTTPAGAPVRPLLITPLINETSVDWK